MSTVLVLPHDMQPAASVKGVALYCYPATAKAAQNIIAVGVHGGSHAAWSLGLYASLLAAAGITVVTFDWRGHGKSETLPEEQAIGRSHADIAKDELAIAVEYAKHNLGADQIILFGHSMGGLVVQKFLESHTAMAAVLLASPAPKQVGNVYAPLSLPPHTLYMPGALFRRLAFFQKFSRQLRETYASYLESESPAIIREVSQGKRQGVPVAAASVRQNVRHLLVVSDHRDILTPRYIMKRLARYYNADFLPVDTAGHCNILYGPAAPHVAAMVLDWIKKRPELSAD